MGAAHRPSFLQDPLREKVRHGVCARVRPCSADKSSDRALSGGPAPFTSPPRAAWLFHAITSGDSLGAGCLTTSQDQDSEQESRPGTTHLGVGPRESRAGSRVPRHTSSSPAVQATCQGGAVRTGGPTQRGPPPTYQWKHHAPCWQSTLPRSGYARASAEAPWSILVINN